MKPDRDVPAAAGGDNRRGQPALSDSPRRVVSILAGGGQLPAEIALEIARTGRTPRVVALAGIADADFTGLSVEPVALGQLGRMISALKRDGARDMVVAGYVRRPDLSRLRIDTGFIRHLPTIISLLNGGDDHVMRRIASFFEGRGLNVLGAGDVAPGLLAPAGVVTGNPTIADWDALAAGQRAIAALGPYDIGQAVVLEDGELAAVEGAEGTDGLLARLPPATQRHRVLVKTAKRGQDLRLDLPTIGPDTLRRAADAGIAAIGLDAGRSLIVAGAETRAIAAAAGMAIVGLEAADSEMPQPAPTPAARAASIDVAPVGNQRVAAARIDDARLGLALLEELAVFASPRAALVARRHVLAVNVSEPMAAFLARTRRLGQWGDGRRLRRNVTLVLAPGASLAPDAIDLLTVGPVAVIACDGRTHDGGIREALASRAGAANLCLLERR